jgi:hypothetical protein
MNESKQELFVEIKRLFHELNRLSSGNSNKVWREKRKEIEALMKQIRELTDKWKAE